MDRECSTEASMRLPITRPVIGFGQKDEKAIGSSSAERRYVLGSGCHSPVRMRRRFDGTAGHSDRDHLRAEAAPERAVAALLSVQSASLSQPDA